MLQILWYYFMEQEHVKALIIDNTINDNYHLMVPSPNVKKFLSISKFIMQYETIQYNAHRIGSKPKWFDASFFVKVCGEN